VQNLPIEVSVIDAVQEALTNGSRVSFRVFAADAAPPVTYASREAHALYAPRLLVFTSNTPPNISTLPDQTTDETFRSPCP